LDDIVSDLQEIITANPTKTNAIAAVRQYFRKEKFHHKRVISNPDVLPPGILLFVMLPLGFIQLNQDLSLEAHSALKRD
jgi:hypothetical protein